MSTEKTAHAVRDLLESFAGDPDGALARVGELYADDVHFQDPIQSLDGRDAFLAMNRRLLARARELRFEVTDTAWHLDRIFLTWTMRLRPKVGPTLSWDGATHLRLRDGRIADHRDYWDLLSAASGLPLLGPAYRALIARALG